MAQRIVRLRTAGLSYPFSRHIFYRGTILYPLRLSGFRFLCRSDRFRWSREILVCRKMFSSN